MTHMIRSGVLQGFTDLAVNLSVDPTEVLNKSGIDPRQLENEDEMISMKSILTVLELTAEVSECSHVGLLLAKSQQTDFVGLVGILMESSPTLGWALQKAMAFFRIHAQGVNWEVAPNLGIATWTVVFDVPASIPHQQSIELAVGQAFRLLRTMSNNRWKPLRICFRHMKTENTWFYEQYFKVPIEFNAEFDGFLFKSEDLEIPISNKDARVYHALAQYAELLAGNESQDLTSKVKRLIRKLLPESQCSIDAVASLLAYDKRTLQRKLKKEGSSYQSLLDEIRYDVAAEYLKNSSLTLAYIASMLGYDEFSSFSRAFKKHFGSSPSEWRKQEQQR